MRYLHSYHHVLALPSRYATIAGHSLQNANIIMPIMCMTAQIQCDHRAIVSRHLQSHALTTALRNHYGVTLTSLE